MKWSNQQDQALKKIKAWFSKREPLFKLFGYAGTGKTTLARQIQEDVGGNVLFAAYTGKAAHVLQQKGCHGASTIHSLIYHTADKSKERLFNLKSELAELVKELHDQSANARIGTHPDVIRLKREITAEETELAKPFFRLNRDSIVRDADLVIIDECSMVGKQMGKDLLSFNTPILVLGDPAQLPPVGDGGFFTLGNPHHMLSEIHRQAADNPIIRLATQIRKGQGVDHGTYGQSAVVPRVQVTPEMAKAADQIIVGKNNTRRACNVRLRELHGRTTPGAPEKYDKLVCLRNNYDLGLLNGSLWNVVEAGEPDDDYVSVRIAPNEDFLAGEEIETLAHASIFKGVDLNMPYWDRKLADEFDFGYALTCHKAQGSQWDNVLIFDESGIFRAHRVNWLYTAVTRAAEKVTIVKG
jgi:exodeoxyribonuclease-5